MTECRLQWHLATLMADQGLRNKDLAYRTGLHHVTISKLKHATMPDRIESSTLEKLCLALECSPGELIRFSQPFPDHQDEGIYSAAQKERLVPHGPPPDGMEGDRPSTRPSITLTEPQHQALSTAASAITERTIDLMLVLDKLIPRETLNQVTPHLVQILADSHQQLNVLKGIESGCVDTPGRQTEPCLAGQRT